MVLHDQNVGQDQKVVKWLKLSQTKAEDTLEHTSCLKHAVAKTLARCHVWPLSIVTNPSKTTNHCENNPKKVQSLGNELKRSSKPASGCLGRLSTLVHTCGRSWMQASVLGGALGCLKTRIGDIG